MKKEKMILHFLGFYPFRSILLGIVVIFAAVFEIFSLSIFVPILEYIQQGPNLTASNHVVAFMLNLFKFFHISRPTLVSFLILAFIASVLQFSMIFLRGVLTALLFFPVRKKIRDECFNSLMNTAVSYHTEKKSSHIASIMIERVDMVGYAINMFVRIISDGLLMAAYLVFLVFISWQVCAIIFVVGVIKHLATLVFIKRAESLGEKWLKGANRQMMRLLESLRAIRLIKSMSRESYEKKRFSEATEYQSNIQIKHTMNSEMMTAIDALVAPFSFVLIIYVSVNILHLSGSYILVFLFALMRMIPQLSTINKNRNQLSLNMANMDAVFDLLDEENKPKIEKGEIKIEKFEDVIKFNEVNFRYKKNMTVLEDVSFSIPKGTSLAVVGASGSGKSTIMDLLLHLYDPTSGDVTIDGTSLRKYDICSWHNLVGIVHQDSFIFNDTIHNNILYGNLNAREQDVVEAAKKAHIHDYIVEQPDGYNTLLGERGINLSGGQRQRLSIARAILKKPEILILDEATSSLDSISEGMIQESIEEISKECTMILVAHRLSTVRSADKILVLEKGRIVEKGTHRRLLENKGKYWEYYTTQSKDFKEKDYEKVEV